MANTDLDYTPESPDLSGETPYEPDAIHPQHQTYRASISLHSPYTPVDLRSPFGSISGSQRRTSYFSHQQGLIAEQQQQLEMKEEDMADDDEYMPDSKPAPSRSKRAVAAAIDDGNGSAGEIEVRTKFPVARIKRIMQADEDVGKVAQVTPVVVSKALELFMISLVTKAANEARNRSSKRVLPMHLKQVVLQNEQFDFLNDIVGKVADAPAPTKHEDSDDEGHVKKKKPSSRRKGKSSDDS